MLNKDEYNGDKIGDDTYAYGVTARDNSRGMCPYNQLRIISLYLAGRILSKTDEHSCQLETPLTMFLYGVSVTA